ncbi:2-succinyl-6-hydroxy-2,4-cyclohexadiene-1-carboxylate synthase [Salmonella enterica]
MILHGQVFAGRQRLPWLVFLHGFSGDGSEWQEVGASFADYPRLYLDLPGHGGSADIRVASFTDLSAVLRATLDSYNILSYWLVGYSLGARIAMFYACHDPAGLCGLVLEGGHPGLTDAQAREQRLESDRQWAVRFHHQPLPAVFADWYKQSVFASLSEGQRAALVAQRSQNNGPALAQMLEATSLAQQPDLRAGLADATFPIHYLYGEFDSKFQALATQVTAVANCHTIPDAGHNAHRENPTAVVATLAHILRREIKETL